MAAMPQAVTHEVWHLWEFPFLFDIRCPVEEEHVHHIGRKEFREFVKMNPETASLELRQHLDFATAAVLEFFGVPALNPK